jgi:cytochrome c553
MKLNVYATESYTTWLVREPVEIDTDNYPELEGMSKDEIKDYIKENAYEMKAINEEYYENLEEELNDKDIRRDKTYGEEISIIFDNE